MSNKFLLVTGFIIFVIQLSFGQTKYEKEYRIPLEEVPMTARLFVDSLNFSKKIKWYYEENLLGNSVEAKVKSDQKKYSIEFDTLGKLQDIEIQLDWGEILPEVRRNITSNLKANFTSHKIYKIQIQYSGNPQNLLSLIKRGTTKEIYTTRYEIVVKGRKEKKVNLYEITFTDNGEIIDIARIIFRNTDNLEF